MEPSSHDPRRPQAASLASRGSWGRFFVAMALISLIPSLVLVAFLVGPLSMVPLSPGLRGAILLLMGVIIVLGYALLIRYPQTTVQLRRYLQRMAKGELPEGVQFARDESDIVAIEKCLNAIVFQARWKVTMIEQQREALLEAERQRVMIESLGAACHHLGQPATTLTMQLALLKARADTPEQRQQIDECIATVEAMGDILHRLRETSQYLTEPYIKSEGRSSMDGRIIAF